MSKLFPLSTFLVFLLSGMTEMVVQGQNTAVTLSENVESNLQEILRTAGENNSFLFDNPAIPNLYALHATPLMIHGTIRNGRPDSSWVISSGQLSPSSSAIAPDYTYQIKMNGQVRESRGSFQHGIYQGLWLHSMVQLSNSTPVNTLFKSQMTFQNGTIVRSFRIENESLILLGRYLRSGLAHDIWTVYSSNPNPEEWYFHEGKLKKVQAEIHQEGIEELTVFADTSITYEVINLDEQYLDVVHSHLLINNNVPMDFETKGSVLIKANATSIKDSYTAISSLVDTVQAPKVPVSVPVYLLNSVEMDLLSSIQMKSVDIGNEIDRVLSNSSLRILSLRDGDVAEKLATVETINQRWMSSYHRVGSFFRKGSLRHIPVNAYVNAIWRKSNSDSLLVSYDFRDGQIERYYHLGFTPDSDHFSLKDFHLRLEHLSDELQVIIDALDNNVQKNRTQAVIDTLEEKIIEKTKALENTLQGIPLDIQESYGFNDIMKAADKIITQYARGEFEDEQRVAAENLLSCLDEFILLAETARLQEQRSFEIRELYTDKVWNNFTQTVMTEQVKKRLTEAYFGYILPYFRAKISENIDCNEAYQTAIMIDVAYQRMVALREMDSSDLEGALKGKKEAKKILELMEIDKPN